MPIVKIYWGDLGVRLAWDGASLPGSAHLATAREQRIRPLLARIHQHDRWREVRRRSLWMPTHVVSKAAARARHRMSAEVVEFLGDALVYFAARGTTESPGPIVRRVLAGLEAAAAPRAARGDEPLVVFSHSMGGQIIYDLVTHFLPALHPDGDLRIDFWAAASSQVGLFEELKLFAVSDFAHGPGTPVPAPDRRYLGHWWNVWDPDDFLSFSVRDIIAGADDMPYKSGLGAGMAHFGILRQPSFYQLFSERLQAALAAR
ncbi:hypothetical protein [Candidatus Chloroploca asiatica]|uniref:Alpha/beta hydrolase n=1 Tax=Candidatus Chloroploca asiatica TaxID=1506545 RepID=A0A2H3L3Z1_9CHLR|nr:hypothetical protein [Candidatus Chloroploca asiatica]PDV97860.1 hypothetical protein A9Q02_17235 [Candidatus Chloroploca asiatica]